MIHIYLLNEGIFSKSIATRNWTKISLIFLSILIFAFDIISLLSVRDSYG
ncbi:hypothetical protein TEQUI_0797 [Taylorella equigenitalis MCE9]|uniref:Uncharacterized protein n=1 Tax=Taylorella equigenitalis (strain MCE9) TaxID=937774 RepID=A0A654KH70_TAYEM|nr:hypothetical protein TEQUI_0797 [Taylorella equigenitalis MCE9]